MNIIMEQNDTYNYLEERLIAIYRRKNPPKPENFLPIVNKVNSVLNNEDESIRPLDNDNLTGGLLSLNKELDTIIIPDIHGRLDLLINIFLSIKDDETTYLERLCKEEIQVVCLGDGMHGEGRAAARWKAAFNEYKKAYKKHHNIDEEMRDSFGVMEMIMELKIMCPKNFHFLKGNHENITNERGGGNFPFIKYSYEGAMVAYYTEKFYGKEFLKSYYHFEKSLPLLAIGNIFIISHSEPATYISDEMIINYRKYPEVTFYLTWTDDDAAEENSVEEMIKQFINSENQEHALYFGGHRPVIDRYNTRAKGKYIQIHNPNKFIIAYINQSEPIDLNKAIIEIEDKTDEIIKAVLGVEHDRKKI